MAAGNENQDPTVVPGSVYYIHPSDNANTKMVNELFDGTGYNSWKRTMMLGFSSRNKLGFVNGSVVQPPETDPNYGAWQRCNDLVIAAYKFDYRPFVMEILDPISNKVIQELKIGPSGVVSRLKTDFEEVKPLGFGGYGCVTLVQNKIDGQSYALKKVKFSVDSEIPYDEAVREAKAMSRLNHPNIVRYHTAWLEKDIIGFVYDEEGNFVEANGEEAGSMLCILQELCYGSLKDIMKDLTEEKANSLFKQIVEGVKYIHNEGIAHGDLTPSNIFLNATKEIVKIGDFGIAQLSKELHQCPTTIYRAPELGDPCTFTANSDIYSLGIIALEMYARFGSDMEKYNDLQEFKKERTWPKSINNSTKILINIMTKDSPEERPTANIILGYLDSI